MHAVSPAISVLLPVRNGQSTLSAALRDLITALDVNDEILAVDDGSRDGTSKILRRMSSEFPQLHVIQTSGIGLVDALNLGLREARCDWIARADADDRYPADRLAHQRAVARDDTVLVSGDYRITSGTRDLGLVPSALGHPFVAASLIHPHRVPHPGVLFHRGAVLSVGGYRPEDFPAEDIALWLRLASVGRLVGVPYQTVSWSMNQGSITHSRQRAQRIKAMQLIQDAFPTHVFNDLGIEDVEKEFASYGAHSLASERRILLTRDLRALALRGVALEGYRCARTSVLTRPWSSGVAALKLSFEKWRRSEVRQRVTTPQPSVTAGGTWVTD